MKTIKDVASGWFGVEPIWRDAKHALRQLSRSPGFALAVIFTLALSIGANTAIFSVVNALLIKALPYAEPFRLGAIYGRTTGPQSFDQRRNLDGEQWERLRDEVPSLLSAVYSPGTATVNLRAGSRAQPVQNGRVSARYFGVLGIEPLIGSGFSEDEDRPNGPKAVVLTYYLWRNAFGGDPAVLGRAVLLKGELFTVVGVLPQGAVTPLGADVYTALQPSREGEGRARNFSAVVRLRDGRTWQQADAELNRAWADSDWDRRFVAENPGAKLSYYLVPLQAAQTDALRPEVLALMLAAGFILLIACANLAGLALVRTLRRGGEIATRLALGASTWRIQRQLWIENLLLALAGGAGALGVGFIVLELLLRLLPRRFLPVDTVALDGRVLAFTLSLSVLTCVLFGALPALAMRKTDLRISMGSRGVIRAGDVRVRKGLIAGEVGLTVVLLAGAGLLIRTLIHLETLPPGFDAKGVITAKASLDDVRYSDPAALRKLLGESLGAVRAIPGVRNAAVASTLPYERALIDGVGLGNGGRAGQSVSADEVFVTPEYFDTLRIPMFSGRAFEERDGPGAQPVVIVNRAFARKFLPGLDPIGLYLTRLNPAGQKLLIVGVVGDTLLSSVAELNEGSAPLTAEETIYLPYAQIADGGFLSRMHAFFQPSWIVRTSTPIAGLTAQMQRELSALDSNLTFSGFYAIDDLMLKTLATQRVEVALLTTMASLALLLSALGIFALVANIVAQRTREFGIRIALGATMRNIMLHVARTGVSAAVVGGAAGLLISAGALRAMRSVVYGVGVYDATTILVVVLLLGLVIFVAAILPALRVGRIDPVETLRNE
ncbi:MAG TPA: ADOP family duplicated permease [Gammaproteobacteria bacterium]|nr:ADOP family duplicated permease [Gammaproteobacteria bacterium]